MRFLLLALAVTSSLAFTRSGDGGAPDAMQACADELRNMCREPRPAADAAFLETCMAARGFMLKTDGDCADPRRPLGAACFEAAPTSWLTSDPAAEPRMSH